MREWSRCGSVRNGATACKAERHMVAAAERVKRGYSEDEPEVIDIETGYEDNSMEEDVVERPRNRGRKAAPPLHAQGRVGGNVYEVYQVQPRSTMQRDVLIKNDSGAQITSIAPDLYGFGIKEGFIKNEREFETEERKEPPPGLRGAYWPLEGAVQLAQALGGPRSPPARSDPGTHCSNWPRCGCTGGPGAPGGHTKTSKLATDVIRSMCTPNGIPREALVRF
jgi:hypothetical protein